MLSTITDLYFPIFKLPTALHRRGNTFYIVFPRAYGMAAGNKCFAQLNFPLDSDPSPDPPSSQPHLNPRFWHRESAGHPLEMTFANLMGVEPEVFKDVGLRRTIKVDGKEVEERLVEVLIREEEYCQRCAWCGEWEYSYEGSSRHSKEKQQIDGTTLYWCGVSGYCMRLVRWLMFD
jgi:hypothetical protein